MNNKENDLTEQEKEARSRYFKEWRERNKEKVRTYNKRFWQKRAEQKLEEEKKHD